MKTGVAVTPMHRYPTRWKLARQNSHSSQEPKVDDKAKNKVSAPSKRKRDREKRRARINYLPKEVIFNILRFLPAKLLQDVMRYVCKQWYDIVSDPFFVRAHCQMPTTASASASFIIQSHDKRDKLYCADTYASKKSVKLTKIKLPFPVKIQGSFNGLILVSDDRDLGNVHLMNPLRKLMFSLPPVVRVVQRKPFGTFYSFAVNSSGQYKMVCFSLYESPEDSEMSVFTIGVDKAWRRINLEHLEGISLIHIFKRHGLLIAGFLYWCNSYHFSFAMDVDKETILRISWPTDIDIKRFFRKSRVIRMGTDLGLITEDENKCGILKLLKLTDVKSSTAWTKIAMIDIGAIVRKVSNYKETFSFLLMNPVSLIDGELCFCFYQYISDKSSLVIRYNLANKKPNVFGVVVAHLIP
ncbi:uncharacterized protein LOC141655775 [Silene latifolia]|uniref:uncharacterized protein LOC141655775 n=1 Tax=Silene latifolia TaxID=37657 RepID=UPI003D778CFD